MTCGMNNGQPYEIRLTTLAGSVCIAIERKPVSLFLSIFWWFWILFNVFRIYKSMRQHSRQLGHHQRQVHLIKMLRPTELCRSLLRSLSPWVELLVVHLWSATMRRKRRQAANHLKRAHHLFHHAWVHALCLRPLQSNQPLSSVF